MTAKKKKVPEVGYWVDVGFFDDVIHVGLIVEALFSGGFRVFFPSGMGLRTVDASQVRSVRWQVKAPVVRTPRKRKKEAEKSVISPKKGEKSAISAEKKGAISAKKAEKVTKKAEKQAISA